MNVPVTCRGGLGYSLSETTSTLNSQLSTPFSTLNSLLANAGINLRLIISTIDRTFRIGDIGMNGTLESMVVGKKYALGTGDAVHEFGADECRPATRPDTPNH
jgi:hypothetical protein